MPVNAVPAVAFAILIVPLFDTLRVFAIRMLRGRSPFSADRNHIHHYLLELKLNHKQTTFVAVVSNIIFIVAAFSLQDIGPNYLMLIVVGAAVAGTVVLYFAKKGKTVPRPVPVRQVTVPAAATVNTAAANAATPAAASDAVVAKPKILRVNPEGMLQDK